MLSVLLVALGAGLLVVLTTTGGAQPTEDWNASIGDTADETAPAVANGTVYFGSEDGNLYAFDADTGAQEWTFYTSSSYGQAVSSPVVVNGTVYFGSRDGNLYAVYENGTERWNFSTGQSIESTPLVANGTVYVGSDDDKLYAVDADTGTQQWNYTTGDWVYATPVEANGVVYASSWDGYLYALDAPTGALQWSSRAAASGIRSFPTVENGTVYVGNQFDQLTATDTTTQTEVWRFRAGDRIVDAPAVANGTVYVGSHDNKLYALDEGSGTERWNFTTGYSVEASPTVVAGTVYVGSGDGKLYAVDADTGAEEWNYTAGSEVYAPRVVAGTAYFGTYAGDVYALSLPTAAGSPAASASANATDVATGSTIQFDGSGSSGATSYAWTVTRNGNVVATSSSATFSREFSTAGVYNATLTASDGGDRDADSVTVVVGDGGPPTAAIDAYPRTAVVGESVQLFSGNSKDDLTNGIAQYEWDFDGDGTYDRTTMPSSGSGGVLVSHSYGSTGTRTAEVRVTDYAGNTDRATVNVTVRPSPTVTSSSVTWTGNGTQPTGTISAKTTTAGGMFLFYLHPQGSPNTRDVSSTGADTTTELWVNFTVTNYDPDAVMGGADLRDWNATPNANGAGTNLSLRLEPIEMERNSSFTGTAPAQWEAKYDRADVGIDAGVYLGAFDVPGGDVEANMTGAALTSDAQAFVPPRYDEQSGTLNYSVAAPGWKKDLDGSGNKVRNTGFYEATIPAGLVDWMGIDDPDALAGVYRSNGSASDLAGMQVVDRPDGSLYVNVTGIHYSSATVSLRRDGTPPVADLADATGSPGQSVTLDASGSSDNRKIVTYEWDVDDDGTYEVSTGSASTSRSFASTGDHTVGLRVTDGAGNVDTDTATVSISSDDGGVSGGGAGGFSPATTTTTTEPTGQSSTTTATRPATTTPPASTQRRTTVDSPTATATGTTTASTGTTPSPGQPGFGAAAALLALLATLAAARRR